MDLILDFITLLGTKNMWLFNIKFFAPPHR